MFTIDSDDKTDPEDPIGKLMAPLIKGMANLEMTHTMDTSGEVTNVAFSEESLKKLKAVWWRQQTCLRRRHVQVRTAWKSSLTSGLVLS